MGKLLNKHIGQFVVGVSLLAIGGSSTLFWYIYDTTNYHSFLFTEISKKIDGIPSKEDFGLIKNDIDTLKKSVEHHERRLTNLEGDK